MEWRRRDEFDPDIELFLKSPDVQFRLVRPVFMDLQADVTFLAQVASVHILV